MANVGWLQIKSPYMANVGNKTNHLIWQTLVTKQITLYGKRWQQNKSPYMANVDNNTNHLLW